MLDILMAADHIRFRNVLHCLSHGNQDEIELEVLVDRIKYHCLYHIYMAAVAKLEHVYYCNPDPIVCQEILYFDLCGYQVNCYEASKCPEITEPILKNAQLISIVTFATFSCSIPPFKYLCKKYNRYRARRELGWFLEVIATREKKVHVDARALSFEHLEQIVKCETITRLTLSKFTKELDALFLRCKHLTSVYTPYNMKYPFLPQTRDLTVDLSGIHEVFSSDIRIGMHTEYLTIMMNYASPYPVVMTQLMSFLKLKVPKLKIQIGFDSLLSYRVNRRWEVQFAKDVIDMYAIAAEAAMEKCNQKRCIEITFNCKDVKGMKRFANCKSVAATELKKHIYFKLVDDDPNNVIFIIPIKNRNWAFKVTMA